MGRVVCEKCSDRPILYLVKVYNTKTGQEMWICKECLEFED